MPTSGLSFKKIQRKSITFWLQTRSQFCTDYYFIMTRKYGYLYYLQNKMEPSKNILIDGFQAFTIWTKYWNFFFSIFKRKEGNIPTALHNQHMNTFWLLSAIFARATKIGHFFLFLIPLILPGAAALCEEMRSPAQHLRVGERGTPCRTKPPSTVTWTTNPPPDPLQEPWSRMWTMEWRWSYTELRIEQVSCLPFIQFSSLKCTWVGHYPKGSAVLIHGCWSSRRSVFAQGPGALNVESGLVHSHLEQLLVFIYWVPYVCIAAASLLINVTHVLHHAATTPWIQLTILEMKSDHIMLIHWPSKDIEDVRWFYGVE